MSSVENNLVEGNKAYASTFTQGDLALPPSQKYAVGTYACMHLAFRKGVFSRCFCGSGSCEHPPFPPPYSLIIFETNL